MTYTLSKIVAIEESASNCKTIRLQSTSENKRFPYFKAGQFVTIFFSICLYYFTYLTSKFC